MTRNRSISRRGFLRGGGGSGHCPLPIRAFVRPRQGRDHRPSNRIIYGLIGCGDHGVDWNLVQIFRYADAQIIARLRRRREPPQDRPDPRGRALCQGTGPQELQGLRRLRRLPRVDQPQGHRRRRQLHARPLARDPGHHGRQGRQGRDLREAADADRRRGPDALRRDQEDRPHLPDRLREPLDRHLHSAVRTGPQRPDRADSSTFACPCPAATRPAARTSTIAEVQPVPKGSTTRCGRARPRWPPTARPDATATSAGTSLTPAAV